MNWALLVAPVVGAMVGLAVVLAVASVVWPAPPPRPRRAAAPQTLAQRWARLTRRPPGAAGRRRDLMLLVGLGVGIVGFILTRWIALVAIVPVAMLILPKMLGQAPPTDLPLLTALDRWVRILATNLGVGRSVVDAVRHSAQSAPDLIIGEVRELVARLDARQPEQDAFQAFAEDLDNPEADAVIASLMLATRHPSGAGENLRAIADSIQDRIRALRAIETERQKPRQTARLVTILSLLLIAGTAVLGGGGYFNGLASPTGQIVVVALATGYVGSLLMMYRITLPRRRERILINGQGRP